MKLLFGTGNQAKLNVMKIRLKPLGINLIGLEDLKKEGFEDKNAQASYDQAS